MQNQSRQDSSEGGSGSFEKDNVKDPIDAFFSSAIDRVFNEFLLISLSTPSTFSDYEVWLMFFSDRTS